MNDGDALLAAILAHHDEDTPRLMYADWLDERAQPGDAERAEFIRLQIDIAQKEATEPKDKDAIYLAGYRLSMHRNETLLNTFVGNGEPCRCVLCLQKREHELILASRNAVEWRGDLVAQLPNGKSEFRRGFIESIRCTSADWFTHADAILKQHPVREVTLTDHEAWNRGIGFLELKLDVSGQWRSPRWPGVRFTPGAPLDFYVGIAEMGAPRCYEILPDTNYDSGTQSITRRFAVLGAIDERAAIAAIGLANDDGGRHPTRPEFSRTRVETRRLPGGDWSVIVTYTRMPVETTDYNYAAAAEADVTFRRLLHPQPVREWRPSSPIETPPEAPPDA